MNDELEIVRGFLKERLNVDPARVAPAATLKELDIDSLMLLELFFEFEERLNISLSQNLPTPKTVGDMIRIVERLRGTAKAG
ncbi:MAG TPA: phosphopantetheine-binding protein [Rhodocyclaceae bacterium]|nr:phosphopantetheine-binding protein [Rhodocyclaceae bacterium]